MAIYGVLTKTVVTATIVAATSRRKAEISAIFEDTRLKHTAANMKSVGIDRRLLILCLCFQKAEGEVHIECSYGTLL